MRTHWDIDGRSDVRTCRDVLELFRQGGEIPHTNYVFMSVLDACAVWPLRVLIANISLVSDTLNCSHGV